MLPRDLRRERDLRILLVEQATALKLGRKLQQLLWKREIVSMSPSLESVVAFVLFLRAERTFASIRTLARLGLVDDAFALVRVMVEKVINAEYILLTGADAAADYIGFDSFRAWRDFEDLRQVHHAAAPKYTPKTLAKMQEAHDQIKMRSLPDGSKKPRYGRGYDWIDIGLPKRAEIVDEALRKRLSKKQGFIATRLLYQSMYKAGATYLHGMWGSSARSFLTTKIDDVAGKEYVETDIKIRLKDKDPRVAADALNSANVVAASMMLFIGQIFDQRWAGVWVSAFLPSYLAELREARREPVNAK